LSAVRVTVALVALALTGCLQPPDSYLVVDFATDLESGTRFVGIETELTREGEPVGEHLAIARIGDSFLEPIRLTTFDGLEPGLYRLHVALTDLEGDVVVERPLLVVVDGAAAVTAVLSVLCEDATCPPGGSPDLTSCVGGRCVDPRCSDEAQEFCPDGCEADADCPGGGVCVAGVCLGGALEPADCDDDDPCTDDALGDDGCVHTPNTAGCDDGVFCNGPDTCLDGECAVHGTPPCAVERCDEATRTCDTGCVVDADCPDPVLGTWSTCEYSSVCDRDGTRMRTVTRFTCDAGRCVADPSDESEACARDTDGDACGTAGCDDWDDCRFMPCETGGERYRRCRLPRCFDGDCDPNERLETESCSRPSVEGTSCRPRGSFCDGVCRSEECTELCEHCGGYCSITGCATGSC